MYSTPPPAASCPIKFETEAGTQEPLKDWYRGFPDASRGWLLRDFGGVEMTKFHYEQLSNMHGLIRLFPSSSRKWNIKHSRRLLL
eukprot:6288089-Prymnesium_polylepis.1